MTNFGRLRIKTDFSRRSQISFPWSGRYLFRPTQSCLVSTVHFISGYPFFRHFSLIKQLRQRWVHYQFLNHFDRSSSPCLTIHWLYALILPRKRGRKIWPNPGKGCLCCLPIWLTFQSNTLFNAAFGRQAHFL